MKSENIFIYYGPKSYFEEQISQISNYKNLLDIVKISDGCRDKFIEVDLEQGKISKEYKIGIENIIAFSDEYSLISEGGTNAFISLLSAFVFNNFYLHNPPKYIVEQLKRNFTNIIECSYEYEKFDIQKLKEVNQLFDEKVFGQEKVKNKLLRLFISNIELSTTKKPIVLLFYGPSGVGKTETAKLLSEIIGQKLFRQQLSMYQNNEFYSYLFGDVHYKNSFSRDLLERKSNIILLDEFDKCNPIFCSAFYQLFDEGIFEDKNYSVKLEDTIIICTSNYSNEKEIREKIGDPIFYRFDGIIKFSSLSKEIIEKIIIKKYNEIIFNLSKEQKRLLEENRSLTTLLSVANNFENFRNIDSFIREYISGVILETYL